jgi:hypothetical protein
MSISEVSDILRNKGEVIIELNHESVDFTLYSILFTQKEEQNLYGGWIELTFMEGKYSGAYIEGFELESIDVICDFSKATKSVTTTPSP